MQRSRGALSELSATERNLLIALILVLFGGAVLSAFLVGDDSPARSDLGAPATTSTAAPSASTSTTPAEVTTATSAPEAPTTIPTPGTEGAAAAPTSGLGAGGTGGAAGAALTSPDTGGEDLLVPALGLMLGAAAARRLRDSH